MENKLLAELMIDLESSDESKRIYAVEDLCEIKDLEIDTALINRLQKEKSQLVRETIVDALKKMISPELFDGIYKMFYSNDAFTRTATTMIFAAGGDAAIDFLAQSFPSANSEIKKLILDSLFEIGTPKARRVIRLGLYDNDMNVMISSIEFLGLLGDCESGPKFIEVLKSANQPMLIITLLRSISKTCDSRLINQAVEILLPARNYNELNNLYLGEILNLIGETGSVEEILKILEVDFDYSIYSEEISLLLMVSTKRFQEIISYNKVRETIFKILNENNINNNTLLNILHLIAYSKNTSINAGTEKLSVANIVDEKKFRNQLIELLNKDWHGING